jgi:hypothetical protein
MSISHFRFNKFAFFLIFFPIILKYAILFRFGFGDLLRKAYTIKICLYCDFFFLKNIGWALGE